MRLATVIAGAMHLSTISALSAAAKLRAVLQAPGAVLCPGVHDALSTRVFAEAGANVLFLSGFGVSACRGEPDAGILTRVEMEEVARQCVAAAGGVPLIVDGDTGFGGASNLRRTAGSGVRVVDRDAAVARVRTALKARDESREAGRDILVIARTDCRAALGLEEAIARCEAFAALGADVVYAENLQDKEEYAELSLKVSSTHLMLAQLQRGDAPSLSPEDVANLGFDLSLVGVTALQAYIATLQSTATSLLATGSASNLAPFDEVKRVVGFDELLDFEERYACD
ncbi:isocitrate lyase [Aureococcus anophagefferens]|nr:isocitrate lyase [Aureococcus anophagefferens]